MGPILFKSRLAALVMLTVATAEAFTTDIAAVPNRALAIGADERLDLAATVGLSRIETVSYLGASYIAVHFAEFALPAGDFVVVHSPNNSSAAATHFYDGKGSDGRGDFIASLVPGDTAIVQYISSTNSSSRLNVSVSKSSESAPAITRLAFKISSFSRGLPTTSTAIGDKEIICGAGDNSRPAKCYVIARPEIYRKARAVARLVIGGTKVCTGWLAGSGRYVITNNHCISNVATAAKVEFEFGAESDSRDSTACEGQLACRKTPVATTSTLVLTNVALDYAVVKLPETADVSAYGYLQYRPSGPVVREQIYIPQHPEGFVKCISVVVDNGSAAKIESLAAASSCGGTNRVGYLADTEPGSSGSPVLAMSDNTVVALHNCGGCLNAGVSIVQIVAHMKDNNVVLPDFAIPTSAPTQTPKPLVADRGSGLSEVLCSEFLCEWSDASASCSSFQ